MRLTAIAVVFLAGEPTASEAPIDGDPVVAVVLDRELHRSQMDSVPNLIYDTLLRKYVAENDLAPTDDEIDEFLKLRRAACERARQEHLAERERLRRELASPDLEPDDAEKLATSLRAKESRLRVPCEKEDRELARWVVYNWKINSSLFHRYGGRVFWEQTAYDPKDARVRFLREHARNGTFEISDASVEQRFWRYFTFFGSGQLVSEETGIEEMTRPWWRRGPRDSP